MIKKRAEAWLLSEIWKAEFIKDCERVKKLEQAEKILLEFANHIEITKGG